MHPPQRITGSDRSWPLHDAESTRRVEARAQGERTPHALMHAAGTAVARLALAVSPRLRRCTVLAGPGNNGGDALVAAALLHRAGVEVHVVAFGDPERAPDDARWARSLAVQAGVPIAPAVGTHRWADTGLIIDGMLGLGGGRSLQGPMRDAAEATWRHRGIVLAIDLPSGLHPDTGQTDGVAVRATHTLSLLTLKPGLFTAAGRDHAGEVWFHDLDAMAPDSAASSTLVGGDVARAHWLPRPHASHKGRFGDVVVVGGFSGMEGAARLAAHAALAAGAGRVYVSPLSDAAVDMSRPELMHRTAWWTASPGELGGATLVCGCGGGDAVAATLPALLSHTRRAVLDADALNAIAGDGSLQQRLRARAARQSATVLTPHPLEAARLLGSTVGEVQQDRQRAAAELSRRFHAVVLLKGSGTVIAAPDGPVSINSSGSGRLATPGSGDVLAGWIGGSWAAAGELSADGLPRLVAACAWLHGRAADVTPGSSAARMPLPAADQIHAMRAAVERLPVV